VPLLTEQGRGVALDGLRRRRSEYRNYQSPKNESLPAGSPMFYRCLGCGMPIVMPELWVSKPDLCDECTALSKLGWLE